MEYRWVRRGDKEHEQKKTKFGWSKTARTRAVGSTKVSGGSAPAAVDHAKRKRSGDILRRQLGTMKKESEAKKWPDFYAPHR